MLSFKDRFKHENGYQLRRYQANGRDCRACAAFGECTRSKQGRTIKVSEYEPLLLKHRQLMATESTKKTYRRRKTTVEPVFGLLKECHGARRFLLRGRQKVLSEWHLLATSFNLKSIHRVWSASV